ncbi:class I SAM-dependent methyltransferase [Halonatronum saccharophilum]|uniref:class I SAM-dependent methyltransferase n=1 Tax=Halonatronum saccharophilum TaxID=150060 RepID=UPI0004B01E3F|nr:methyltransferase domain-containing protein [Halonatronum saccharophilum]
MIKLYKPCKSVVESIDFFEENEINSIIDYGAGKLKNSIYLSERGFEVYAVDKMEQLERSKRYYSNIKLKGLIDYNKISSYDLKVDLVISNFVLNIIEGVEIRIRYIDNSYFKLKTGGCLLIEVRRRRGITPKSCNKAFNQNELNELVLSRGFNLIKSRYSKYSLVGLYIKASN